MSDGLTPAPSPGRVCRFCSADISAMRAGSTACRATVCKSALKAEWQRNRRPGRLCRLCAGPVPKASGRFYCSDACYQIARADYQRERMRTPVMQARARIRYLTLTKQRLANNPSYRQSITDRHAELSRAYYQRHRDRAEFMRRRQNYTRQHRRALRLRQLMESLRGRIDRN